MSPSGEPKRSSIPVRGTKWHHTKYPCSGPENNGMTGLWYVDNAVRVQRGRKWQCCTQ